MFRFAAVKKRQILPQIFQNQELKKDNQTFREIFLKCEVFYPVRCVLVFFQMGFIPGF